MVAALTIALIVLGIWAAAAVLWLVRRVYALHAQNDRQQVILAAYKDALQRPAIALLTQDQLELIASYVSPKKEYLN